MDDAEKKMIENLEKNSGKTLEQWKAVLAEQGLEKHGQMIKFLKEEHGFTHGFANMVVHKYRKSDSGSSENLQDLVDAQYKGKEHFLPLYNQLVEAIKRFGDDVEFAPKKAYVSLRRKKQFGCLNPATKSRFEVRLNLKNQPIEDILEASKNSMFTHRINLSVESKDLDKTIDWLKEAYERAQ